MAFKGIQRQREAFAYRLAPRYASPYPEKIPAQHPVGPPWQVDDGHGHRLDPVWDPKMRDPRIDYKKLVDNALSRYRGATPEEIEEGRNWYNGARLWLKNFVDKNGGDYSRAAAIMSALSPQLSWEKNLESGAHFLRTYRPEERDKWITPQGRGTGLPALGENVLRAIELFEADDPRDVMGRDDWGADGAKIHSFWKNFLGDENYVTVDKHMLRALDRAYGEDPLLSYGKSNKDEATPEDLRVAELEKLLGLHTTRTLTDGSQERINTGYNTYADAIREATQLVNAELGPDEQLTPAQMQAIVWIQHKNDMDRFKERKRREKWETKNPGKDFDAYDERRRRNAPPPNRPKWPLPNYEEAVTYGENNPYGDDPLIIGPQRPIFDEEGRPTKKMVLKRDYERESTRPNRTDFGELAPPPVPADNIPDAKPTFEDMAGEEVEGKPGYPWAGPQIAPMYEFNNGPGLPRPYRAASLDPVTAAIAWLEDESWI